jgi:hypothetical protein
MTTPPPPAASKPVLSRLCNGSEAHTSRLGVSFLWATKRSTATQQCICRFHVCWYTDLSYTPTDKNIDGWGSENWVANNVDHHDWSTGPREKDVCDMFSLYS